MSDTTAKPRTIAEEMAAGRRNTPDFGYPTLLLEIALLAASGLATWAAMTGRVSYLTGAIVNTVVLYSAYTIVHEAVHGNISSRHKELRWLDVLAGTIACIPLWLFFFQHTKQHMEHHKYTNTDRDPDIYSKGSFPVWLFIRLPWSLINYFNPVLLYRDCLGFHVPKRQIAMTMITFALQAAVLIGLIAAGYGYELLVLWFIPWWIGQTVMLTLFTWAPHHDHSETGRYRDTRESLFPGGNFLLLGQNHHLIHHMMPGVPFYRYQRTFKEIRPLLEKNDVRIEGFWPNPDYERIEP